MQLVIGMVVSAVKREIIFTFTEQDFGLRTWTLLANSLLSLYPLFLCPILKKETQKYNTNA